MGWPRARQRRWRGVTTSARSAIAALARPAGAGGTATRFRLHALGEELRLAPGAGVAELEQALRDNVLAVAELVGTYER